MSLSACLVCKQARRSAPGLIECYNSGFIHPVMHVCLSFVPLWIAEDVVSHRGFQSCSASTTATNSHSWEKSDGNRGQI